LSLPPHGGVLAATGEGQLELVVGPDRLALYPLDPHLQPLPLGDAAAQLLGVDGAAVDMTAAGDHWEAPNPYGTEAGGRNIRSNRSVILVAVVRRATGASAARFEIQRGQGAMFHDHRPFHGGQVGMAGERHLELALAKSASGQELQLFLTDAYRQPEPLDGIRGELVLQQGGRSTTLPLVPAGDCFTVESGKPSGPLGVHVHLFYPTEPKEVDMDYYFDQRTAMESGAHPVKILVGSGGFSPSRIPATAGQALTLRFYRTTDDTCAKQVIFPSLGLQRELPLQRNVDIALVPGKGETAFSCSMGMITGAVVGR
jgi:hypothetical protein